MPSPLPTPLQKAVHTPQPASTPLGHTPNPPLEGFHIPDFGIPGALDALGSHTAGIFTLFLVAYLLVILVKLIRGDDVEFLGLFKSSRRLQETRRALSEMTLLLRGRGVLFKSIESTLRRQSHMRAGTSPTTNDEALGYLCDWLPRGISFGRKADAHKIVFWVPDGTDLLKVRASAGLSPESLPKMRYPIDPSDPNDDTFGAKAFRYGKPFVSGDVWSDPRYTNFRGNKPSHPYRSLLAVPVFRGTNVIGVLTLDSVHADAFGPDEVGFVELFAWLFAEFA